MIESSQKILPSSKSIWITIIILIVLYTIKFMVRSPDNFELFKYDWSDIQAVKSTDSIKILNLSKNNITLIAPKGFTTNPKDIYELSNTQNKYFFKYKYYTNKGDTLKFFEVKWLKNQAIKTKGLFKITRVKIKLKNE